MQSRRASICEAATSTAIGCLINMVTNYVVLPHYGMRISMADNFALTAIYTAISFARSYGVRRLFANIRERNIR
ncbi:DUF7220 family protein [Burkholderia gladioli]|uniref:DUF7220 family protein n=1 Tax=Burkholderia gladioli TaxID=28095 RepID=UPI00055DA10B|nr:hypothetical protein [Burkholderia gladioli]